MIEVQHPVRGKDLFDREEILEDLIQADKNYALIGFRKSGKTSLMLESERKLKGSLVSYTYILFTETGHSFLLKFINNTIAAYLEYKSDKVEYFEDSIESFDKLTKKLIEIKPEIANLVLEIRDIMQVKGPVPNNLISMAFDLPDRLAENRFIVLLDEFQVLGGLNPALLDILRQKLQTQSKTRYVVAGSLVGMMKEILEREKAPLFGHFELIHVGSFDYRSARGFVREKLPQIRELHLNFLISFTGGHPYYLAIILNRLDKKKGLDKKKEITKSILLDAIREVLFEPQGQLYIYFKETLEEMFRRRNMSRYFQILKAISLGKKRTRDISYFTSLPMSTISPYLDTLLFMELIKRDKKGYQIMDPAMDFWLRSCQRVQESSSMDMKRKLDYFEEKVHQSFASITSELGKARESQIREIFLRKSFEVGSGYLLGGEFDLIAKKEKDLILGEVKTGKVTLKQLNKFIKKMKVVEEEHIVKKKIIFAIFGMDPKAMSVAKKNAIDVWDSKRIDGETKKLNVGLKL